MSSPLVQIDELGDLIRQLHKLDSKLQAGQFIAAYRENRRLISELESKKVELVKEAEAKNAEANDEAIGKDIKVD
jgi:hypothetical protein